MNPAKALLHACRIAALAILSATVVGSTHSATAAPGTDLSVPAFQSIDVRNGAHVVLRHGEEQRVTVIQGNTTESDVRVDDQGRLIVDRCPDGCPRGYRLVVEIVTPEITALAVTDGGWLRCAGRFPRQESLAAAVASGGTLDARVMKVDGVAAAVLHGGRILTEPRETLTAAIAQGGVIVYWGAPEVQQSIDHGGVVSRGRSVDRNRPFEKIEAPVED
jgi:hypothetical protein